MKVLVVGPIKSPIILKLVENLKADGKEVLIASHDVEHADGAFNLGGLHSFLCYLNFFKINRIVRTFNPDLVHAHVVNHYGLMCLFQSKPLVVALWGSDIMQAPHSGSYPKRLIYRLINWLVLKRANRCHTSGYHVADEAEKQCKNTKRKTDVFYWGFPIKKPKEYELKQAAKKLYKEFGLGDDRFFVFPRGVGKIYNPDTAVKVINKLIDVIDNPKRIVVLRGFACKADEDYFKSLINTNCITYIDRLLESAELFFLYDRASVHFSIPHSDSLGGGVVEPALFGSYPVLSKLPSYIKYSENNNSFIIENDDDSVIEVVCEKIRRKEFCKSSSNIPLGFDLPSVLENMNKTYQKALLNN